MEQAEQAHKRHASCMTLQLRTNGPCGPCIVHPCSRGIDERGGKLGISDSEDFTIDILVTYQTYGYMTYAELTKRGMA